MNIFKKFGSKKHEDDGYDSPITVPPSTKSVLKWKHNEVLGFISSLPFYTDEEDFILNYVEENKYKGKAFVSLTHDKLMVYFTKECKKRKTKFKEVVVCSKLSSSILHLKKQGNFEDKEWYDVFFKLIETYWYFTFDVSFSAATYTKYSRTATKLIKYDEFYFHYFQPFISIISFRNEYQVLWRKYSHEQRKKKKFADVKEFNEARKDELTVLKSKVKDFIIEYECRTNEKLNYNYLSLLPPDFYEFRSTKTVSKNDNENLNNVWDLGGGKDYLRIKLVITEIYKDDNRKKFRELISPIMSVIPKYKQRWGVFHTSLCFLFIIIFIKGLIVGPWYLSWDNGEIVVPKPFVSSQAFFAFDVQNISLHNSKKADFDILGVSQKIARVLMKWNSDYKYSSVGSENKGNCQDFVDDVLQSLEINIRSQEDSMINNFLKKLRRTGKAEVEFIPTSRFLKMFDIKWKKKTFESHIELDELVAGWKKALVANCDNLNTLFPSEYAFLKSIDRAYWLKHFKYKKKDEFVPLPASKDEIIADEMATGCPFENPLKTFSFVGKDKSSLSFVSTH